MWQALECSTLGFATINHYAQLHLHGACVEMVFNIFSQRKNREIGKNIDVYQYADMPRQTKIQILHLLTRTIGDGSPYSKSQKVYTQIRNILREEYGVFTLYGETDHAEPYEEVMNFFVSEKEIGRCLDVIELAMLAVENGVMDHDNVDRQHIRETLNARFREAGLGYQYENRKIIRVDHQLIHSEIVKPTIEFLSAPIFKGANNEFMQAHKNYRDGQYKACLVECLKSFESTMKIICDCNGWIVEGDTASRLI